MCGIAGFTRFHHPTGDENTLKQMGDAIIHRGPDAGGVYLDDGVGLCHRRLSIIDLSEDGNQPMFSEDGNLALVFNGEIYNFLPLRAELAKEGYKFKSKTDSEVILALYEKHGEQMVEKIFGMFAIAIWDKKLERLLLYRDRIGKKPLYYYSKNGYFVFASEIKSLLSLPHLEKNIRADAVYDFFTYQYIPDPKTIFEDVFKLEPGHYLSVTKDALENRQYWQLSFADKLSGDNQAIADELLAVIDENVRNRMISDVPLGAFLSGGVDSSGVTALMAKNAKDRVTTCAIGFDSEKFDEVQFAEEVAKQYDTKHYEFTVRENVTENLEAIAAYFDEPFADPSLVPTYFVSQLARQKVTVALAGDGGDESFAGYSKYVTDQVENNLRSKVPQVLRKKLLPPLISLFNVVPGKLAKRLRSLLTTLKHDADYGFFITNSFMDDTFWNKVVRKDFSDKLGGYHPSEVTLKHYWEADADNHLDRILYTDIKTYLPGDILVKVDRMSMANSLEVRAPLLDASVVEFAAKIPAHLKLNNGDKKHILKKSLSKYLSHDILYRKKMGFSVPLDDWFRNEIKGVAEKTLFDCKAGLPDYFKMEELRKIWHMHQLKQADYSSELWSMLMFQFWYNRYIADSDKAVLA
ncbi:MAG: asparagine synthase (glutamine-hydrolyzing) [Cellvibrionaceae bacterium]|nr:asparagine synthase (glutamine-hydrolyzing) [Cellvibrionaceae bacterium]